MACLFNAGPEVLADHPGVLCSGFGQFADFIGDYRESPAGVTGVGRLDCGIHREQVGGDPVIDGVNAAAGEQFAVRDQPEFERKGARSRKSFRDARLARGDAAGLAVGGDRGELAPDGHHHARV